MIGRRRIAAALLAGAAAVEAAPQGCAAPGTRLESDDPSGASATKTRHVELQHANFGQFKTPSLRNAALTAPYMHDGRLATLRDVVRHYSELDLERLHTHGEELLRPLKLSDRESDDLVAFLESLTDPRATAPPGAARPVAGCNP